MIEIIREEEREKVADRQKTLPKDIRQIGKPDSGDRIYIENQVYQFLQSENQACEKTAYVLLGRFEELNGKWCTFVESAICLEDMQFDGSLPLWTDHTWAYIFKNLTHQHDEMAITGCAIDVKGSLPKMTVRLEAIHQKNFGGPHQIMLLMDSLEKEEIFYSNYNGRLYRKEGYYIYYDRNLPESMKLNMQNMWQDNYTVPTGFIPPAASQIVQEQPAIKDDMVALAKTSSNAANASSPEHTAVNNAAEKNHGAKKASSKGKKKKNNGKAKSPAMASRTLDTAAPAANPHDTKKTVSSEEQADIWEQPFSDRTVSEESFSPYDDRHDAKQFAPKESPKRQNIPPRNDAGEDAWSRRVSEHAKSGGTQSGRYRERLNAKSKKPRIPSYVPSVALLAIVCLMGFAAFENHRKVNQMQANADDPNVNQAMAEQNNSTEDIKVEKVSGNVKPLDEPSTTDPNVLPDKVSPQKTDSPQTADTQSSEVQDIQNTQIADETVAENVPADNTPETPAGNEPADGTAQNEPAPEDSSAEESAPTDTGASEDAMAQNKADEIQAYLDQGYYIVQKGDSLVGICRKIYRTTAMLDKLCEANQIEDRDAIYAGQRLTLPN